MFLLLNKKSIINNYAKAFSLLEVLAALAILSIAFFALLQGQGDNLYIVNTVQKRQLAQKYIRKKLYAIERQQEVIVSGQGTFPVSHELAGQRWDLKVTEEEIFGFKLRRVDYAIELEKQGQKSKIKGTIYME